jgi:3-oxoacyl-[acyl-carrier protein] reductase
MKYSPAALVFGASGSIGKSCFNLMSEVCPTFSVSYKDKNFEVGAPFDSVIWAQGINITKNFMETSESEWENVLEANVHFVRKTVKTLLQGQLIQNPASFVFIGSVWGTLAKADKSAYIVSKSALQGLTKSLAIDLAPRGIRVNSVLPGIVDNSMTRANLSAEQIKKVEIETPGGLLVSPDDVARTVRFLCSRESAGLNGQSITVDNGWSIARYT